MRAIPVISITMTIDSIGRLRDRASGLRCSLQRLSVLMHYTLTGIAPRSRTVRLGTA